jgi:hypothetical protein
METDPLKKLTEFFKYMGYVGKEAVEKAEAELDKRRKEREFALRKTAGEKYLLVSFVPPSHSSFNSLL